MFVNSPYIYDNTTRIKTFIKTTKEREAIGTEVIKGISGLPTVREKTQTCPDLYFLLLV